MPQPVHVGKARHLALPVVEVPLPDVRPVGGISDPLSASAQAASSTARCSGVVAGTVRGAIYVVVEICNYFRQEITLLRYKNAVIESLEELTEDEKTILRFYIHGKTKTNYLRYQDGVVQGLESKGIIYLASRRGNMFRGFAYNISKIAWDRLNEKRGLLSGETNLARTDRFDTWKDVV
jgi:hypothetical protein